MRAPILIGLVILASACSRPAEPPEQAAAPPPYEDQLRLALETAEPGAVIDIPAGTHNFTRSLTLTTSGVTLRGAGIDATILSFKGQIAGAEGLLVNAGDFTIEDLAIEDTIGDALKVNGGSNIIIRRVRTEWTNGPDTGNGAYGIYPVQTENTLIEDSVAIAASDAGIYVGQSRNVVVRNNRAEFNVAGIEVENTIGADVYGNTAVNNTGGVLVFNMPDLPVNGHSTRVFDNDIHGNNTANFGAPGSAVASVPAGSGIVINSNDRVEIFDNRIGENNTANILISSLFSAEYTQSGESAADFDPYPELIYIYGNTFSPGGSAPDREALDQLRIALFGADGRLPDIVWDGVFDGAKPDAERAICIENTTVGFLNIDAQNNSQSPSTDLAPHDCQLDKLPPIELPFAI
jgi:parallel beta-helix repeat protein